VKERGDALTLFHLIGPALSMTSCLPVMAERLREGESRWGDMDDLATLADAYTEYEDESEFIGEDGTTLLGDHKWLPDHDFEQTDTKFTKLQSELLERSLNEKVIVFAYFKATLRYLKRRLEAEGHACLLVTGDVTDRNERDRLLRSFEDPGYRILLCSEVAAEGVDLQFCRVMVNYDLPWNPMRVEQRIGRIDRIGQKANSIVIINFHVHGTIDGSIYEHLYRKIGIFNDTIGDLEGIVGDRVNRLTLELLSNELSPAQAAEKIRLVAEAIARERATVSEIDEESETLLGLRSYLQNEVRQGRALGRYIKPSELRLFAGEFFRDTYTGPDSCQLNWDTPADDCLKITLSFRAFSDFEEYLNRQSIGWPAGFSQSSRLVALTFDPETHEQQKRKHRSLILANHLHPFVGWMTSAYQARRKIWHPVSAVRLATNEVQEGVYFYLVGRLSLKHPALAKDEILFRAHNIDTGGTLGLMESEALVNHVIEEGESWVAVEFPDCSTAFEVVWKTLTGDCAAIQEAFNEDVELRVNTKRAQVESHFRRRIETAERRVQVMRESIEDREQGIRVTRSQIRHLKERLEEELSKCDPAAGIEPDFKRIACGIIKTARAS